MNNNNQNTTKNITNKKYRTSPFLLDSPENENFRSPDLDLDFLIDSGAESNIINIPTNKTKLCDTSLTLFQRLNKQTPFFSKF